MKLLVGKYRRLHHRYYKQNHKGGCISQLTSGKLHSHLADVEEQAQSKMELLMNQMAKKQGIIDKLKGEDQMAWVEAINNIRICAEEIVFKELVYAYGNPKHAIAEGCKLEKDEIAPKEILGWAREICGNWHNLVL